MLQSYIVNIRLLERKIMVLNNNNNLKTIWQRLELGI